MWSLIKPPKSIYESTLPLLRRYKSSKSHGATSSSTSSSSASPPFTKLLMANRGEIACRVFRTAKRMGIQTVAVYSEADAGARHVASADEAVFIGPAPSSQSYLCIDKIVDACIRTGAQVVHPGYGFLSENSQFVSALDKAGIAFAGPPSSAMLAMGDKINSKKIAKEAQVNIIPGFIGEIETEEEAVRLSRDIGYPVMMKASAGGGGKGMRIAWDDDQAREGFRIAKTEAKSSFGDDRMLIEKFIHNPRHVEIQILADGHGNTLYLNERECSIQRRNQKVLEEAPSPFIDPETRKRMGEQACALARAVGYRSAGTVEMLIDSNRNFYFLEMNTRLQVEHPITELITGQDIVEHMINIAAGKPLPITQADLVPRGWATESRVYAEDPLRGFLPSNGRFTRYKEPPTSVVIPSGEEVLVRTDSGIVEGGEISVYYDPLIAKLITYGSDRQASIEGMKRALDQYIIRGFNNNVCFLRAMMDHPRYVSGNITTNFIPEEFPQGFHGIQFLPEQKNQLLAIASLIHMTNVDEAKTISQQLRMSSDIPHPDAHTFYIRIGADSTHSSPNEGFSKVIVHHPLEEDGPIEVEIDGHRHQLNNPDYDDTIWYSELDGADFSTQYLGKVPSGYKLQHCGSILDVKVYSETEYQLCVHLKQKVAADLSNFLISPMPGAIRQIFVKPGEHVKAGQKLMVVEAMKMQNILVASNDATVKAIPVALGDTVGVDAILIEFEKANKK